MSRLLLAFALPAAAFFLPMTAGAPAASAAPVMMSFHTPDAVSVIEDVRYMHHGHHHMSHHHHYHH